MRARVMSALALEYGDDFVQQTQPQLSQALNEGCRRQHEIVVNGFAGKGAIADFVGHPYLAPFVQSFLGKVAQGTTKLLTSGGADTATSTLRERELLLVAATPGVSPDPFPGMVFRRVDPHQVQLARAGNRMYAPVPGMGLWCWRQVLELFFPTADLKAPQDFFVTVDYLASVDDIAGTALWDQDDAAVSPIDERYLMAPMDFAKAWILERANQPGDVFLQRAVSQAQAIV